MAGDTIEIIKGDLFINGQTSRLLS
ncbi:MAG: hypothetical protein WDM90_00170 [Ferruginibacter sp.]